MTTLALLLLAASPAPCALETADPGLFARLADTRSAIEIHRGKDSPAECVIALDCKVRAGTVSSVEYELATLSGPKTPPQFHQVRKVFLMFADGGSQACAASSVLRAEPPARKPAVEAPKPKPKPAPEVGTPPLQSAE